MIVYEKGATVTCFVEVDGLYSRTSGLSAARRVLPSDECLVMDVTKLRRA